jgi:CDP-glucose 4,6-dehydratase
VRYLVTGHTGFKGAWLCLLLHRTGHEVSGLALDPDPGSLFVTARVDEVLTGDLRCDIRDGQATATAIKDLSPDVVIHMAAQPLVRASYADPRWTMETNVMGTLSVLEGVSATPSVKALVAVTTDKVYRNIGQPQGYLEGDALGGHDPYSASKAMADILVTSWSDSFSPCPITIARAGNVIGGGDVAVDRLFPDLISSFEKGEVAQLRYPDAVRPWQHVLDCLAGYMKLAEATLNGAAGGAWNFGPEPEAFRTVAEAATTAARFWGDEAAWTAQGGEHLHEAQLLTLNASRARNELEWRDKLDFESAVKWTIDWAKQVNLGVDAREMSLTQIDAHLEFTSSTLAESRAHDASQR